MAINSASSPFSSQRCNTLSSRVFSIVVPAILFLSVLPFAHAQNGVGNTTSTPVPGVPHDYITGLNEIVNPANGALSIRIKQPAPPERGYNWPKYAFMYDSNLTYTLIPKWQWQQNGNETIAVLTNINYSYNPLAFQVPLSSLYTTVSACIQNGQQSCATYSCTYYYGYVFTDPDGGRHALGLSVGVPQTQNTSNDCNEFSAQWGGNYVQGGDETIKSLFGGGTVDLHGNIPAFEDTNGNLLNSTGRTTPKPTPDTTTSGTATYSGNYNASAQSSGTGCNFGTDITPIPYVTPPGTLTFPVTSTVVLPNGEKYTFLYDSTYGLLKEIIYPTGASVTYTWSTIPNAEGVQWQSPPQIGTEGGGTGVCAFRHDWFAITKRVVNDGTQNTQEQDFTYNTLWPAQTAGYQWVSKETIVITKDLLKNTSFSTVYQYSPVASPPEAWASWENLGYMPVENSITYNDANGNLLKTVTKVWWSTDLMTAECETLPNGQTSGKFYTYAGYTPFQNSSVLNEAQAGFTNLPTDVAEYDYGAVTTLCQKPTSNALLLRDTVTTYQPFGSTPLFAGLPSIEDRPSSVQVYGMVGATKTLLEETDYVYDGKLPPVAVTPTPVGHDETNYGASSTAPRGNPTTITRKCFVGSTNCTNPVSVTTYTYDTTGQVLSVTDANQNTTNYSYADSYTSDDGNPPGNTNAYVSKITRPVTNGFAHISSFQYGYEDGKLRAATDENTQTTNYCYVTGGYPGGCSTSSPPWDPFFRLTGVSHPDGGQTTYTYNDAGLNPSVQTSTLLNTSGLTKTTLNVADGLGRPSKVELTSDPAGTDYTATVYDGMSRPGTVYNPTRCNPPTTNCGESTWGTTSYTYDALGRTTKVTEADGSAISTLYSSNQTTVTDEAGNQRTTQTDALGRLTNVWEAPNVSGFNYQTSYVYDALGDLTKVTQNGSRIRTFVYDSLARLVTATNPESGQISYTYDLNSNLTGKTAPSPNQTGTATVQTTYTYDALNRLTGKSYTDSDTNNPTTLPVSYGYDGILLTCPIRVGFTGSTGAIGRRTAMCYNIGTTTADNKSWGYDSMGRVTAENDRFTGLVPPYNSSIVGLNNGIETIAANTAYSYYLDGDLQGDSSPAWYEYYTDENAAGQITTVGDEMFNILTNVTYAPTGQLSTALVGETGSYNGNKISNTFNNRLQPVLVSASTNSGTPIMNLTYNFNLGNGTSGTDNGNVIQIVNGKDNNRTQNFSYDPLNRIWQAYTNGPNWGETYSPNIYAAGTAYSTANLGIDAWGNLTNISGVTGKTLSESLNCAGATAQNQLPTSCQFYYDAAGNLTRNGSTTYTYDAENRLIATAGISYIYDGDGNRIEKCTELVSNNVPQPGKCATNATGTFYWLHKDGGTLNESDLGGNFTAAYDLIHGQIAARIDLPSAAVHYYFHDRLGTNDVVTDNLGNVVKESDYYPYGGEISIINNDSNRYKFTGKERDTESGLDNFGARYDASSLGRFMTPDWGTSPTGVPYASFGNPQSLNLYSYVNNNPTTTRDADGHVTCDPDKTVWGPGGVTVIGGACHLDAGDYVRLGYQSILAMTRVASRPVQKGIGDFFTMVASGTLLAGLENGSGDCVCDVKKPSKRFGWKGGAKWRKAVKELNQAGDHPTVAGEVPTREEATEMIREGGGTVLRGGAGEPMDPGEEFGHDPAGDSTHTYPHINYETAAGERAAVKVQ